MSGSIKKNDFLWPMMAVCWIFEVQSTLISVRVQSYAQNKLDGVHRNRTVCELLQQHEEDGI